MVGGGPIPTTTEEDEFLKRNTDCVYFLASPLTCKKGSECEYRHSEIARLNPRDCYYWLSGNCLNPKCAFRHPPLDGLLGAEVPAFAGPPVPPASGKLGVACYYFQQGYCSKGPLCPFLHGPPSVARQPTPPNPVKPSKVPSTGPEKPAQEQKFTQHESIQKPVEFHPSHGKYVPGVQAHAPATNGDNVAMEKKVEPPRQETSRYTPANVAPPPVINEVSISRSNHGVYEGNHTSDNEGTNGKDVDDYSREPTPGFDVLVDTEGGESEYYPNEEQFLRSRGDYDVDREMYPKQRDHGHYNDEGRLWEEHRESSSFGRKRYPRDESPDQFEQSDLRRRLSKQRRGNDVGGLRSVVSREHPRDNYNDRMPRRDIDHNRHGHHHHHHDHHHDRRMEPGSFSSRLRGRINIPRNETGLRLEREVDMGRQHRSRYSPGRTPYTSSNDSRLRDRIKGSRTSYDFDNDRRNHRGSRVSENDKELSRPRRLSESRTQQTDDGQLLGKRKYPRAESQQSEVNASFEGPKPLSEILKRKRGLVISSVVNNENNNSNENNDHNQEERKESPTQNMVNGENRKSTNNQSSLNNKLGSVDEDAMVDQELEAYDSKEADYDYEQIDGEEYYEEADEEYIEEEEGDETGKKDNVVHV